LIIKRVADGKKGSICLCDSEVWTAFKWVGPVWKFVLHNDHNSKLFAGTGTGLVPLYNQIVTTLESGNTSQVTLLFWVRTNADLFYVENFKSLKEKHSNFDYNIALSREDRDEYHKWYITDFVDENMALSYSKVYLCWAPIVVDAMEESLIKLNFRGENIFTEKY
jgi:NAD(P)H-flavin reductase